MKEVRMFSCHWGAADLSPLGPPSWVKLARHLSWIEAPPAEWRTTITLTVLHNTYTNQYFKTTIHPKNNKDRKESCKMNNILWVDVFHIYISVRIFPLLISLAIVSLLSCGGGTVTRRRNFIPKRRNPLGLSNSDFWSLISASDKLEHIFAQEEVCGFCSRRLTLESHYEGIFDCPVWTGGKITASKTCFNVHTGTWTLF